MRCFQRRLLLKLLNRPNRSRLSEREREREERDLDLDLDLERARLTRVHFRFNVSGFLRLLLLLRRFLEPRLLLLLLLELRAFLLDDLFLTMLFFIV